jgi:hypothetical protein
MQFRLEKILRPLAFGLTGGLGSSLFDLLEKTPADRSIIDALGPAAITLAYLFVGCLAIEVAGFLGLRRSLRIRRLWAVAASTTFILYTAAFQLVDSYPIPLPDRLSVGGMVLLGLAALTGLLAGFATAQLPQALALAPLIGVGVVGGLFAANIVLVLAGSWVADSLATALCFAGAGLLAYAARKTLAEQPAVRLQLVMWPLALLLTL